MRRTSVYTLSFDGNDLELDLLVRVAGNIGVTITGSGPDPRPNLMFRAAGDAAACVIADQLSFHENGTTRVRNTTLTTGQGTHTRTVKTEGTKMTTKTSTTYDVVLTDGTGAGSRARKDAAIKLGNMQDDHFTVVSQPSGKVVHDSRTDGAKGTDEEIETPTEDAPVPVETKATAPAKATTPKKEKTVAKTTKKAAPAPEPEASQDEAEAPVMTVEFEGLGKYYARAAGLYGAEKVGAAFGVTATITGTTISLFGSEEDAEQVAEHLRALWPAAKLAHKEYRKNDATYSAISKDRKDKEANAQRWDLEVKWFMAFMDGAADEIAGSAKKKGGAYKDGVLAVRNPAPVADDSDVI
jgi:hypothetical protein